MLESSYLEKAIAAAVGFIFASVLLIAVLTPFNDHPDEESHVFAAAFYEENLVKKSVDSPEMLATIIPGWGISYLHLNDIVYSLAQKTTHWLEYFGVRDFIQYRLFNVGLCFLLFVWLLAQKRHGTCFLVAFALTPQTWYLFSYFNGDAIGIFSSFLLGGVYVQNREKVHDYFWGRSKSFAPVIGLCFLASLVLLSRLNYAVVVGFVLTLILFSEVSARSLREYLPPAARLALFTVVAFSPLALAELWQSAANDFNKYQRLSDVLTVYQLPEFSLSHIQESGQNPHLLYLRDLGYSPADVLRMTDFLWIRSSFASFFGAYGWMDVRAPAIVHFLTCLFGIGFVTLWLMSNAFKADRPLRLVVLIFVVFAFLVVAQSLAHSWLRGFQPQGRYLLPVIPMIAIPLALMASRSASAANNRSWRLYALLLLTGNGVSFFLFAAVPLIRS